MVFLRWWLLVFLGGCAFARAGYVEQSGGKTIVHVTVHDWLWEELDPIRSDTGTRANAEAVKRFKQKFPEIFAEKYGIPHAEVRIEKFSGIKIEGIESDLLAIAGKMAPDVIYLNFRKSDTYIQQGFLYPLTAYAEDMGVAEREFRVHPKIWPVIERKGPGGKHLWALPHGGAIGKVLIYRKDLFDEINLAVSRIRPGPGTTCTRPATRLANPGEGQYAIALRNVKHESWRWLDFLFASGSRVLRYDEASRPAGTWPSTIRRR